MLLAFLLPVLGGSVALSIDVGSMFQLKRRLQTAADAGAMAAAQELKRSSSDTRISAAVLADVASNGFSNGGANTVTVNRPPTTGAKKGNSNYVEVKVQQAAPTFFMRFLGLQTTNVSARAVAGLVAGPTACIYATTLNLSGGSEMDLNCGVIVSGTGSGSVVNSGGSCINASSITLAGSSPGGCLSPTPEVNATLDSDQVDPLANMAAPSYAGCDYSSKVTVNGGSATLSPGVYCQGIDIKGATVTFSPGLYIVGGGLSASGGSSVLTGTGVSFYFTQSSTGSWVVPVNFSGGGSYSFSAMTSGALQGVVFFSDRNTPTNLKPTVSGGGDTAFDGALYFPGLEIVYSGGSGLVRPPCTVIISSKITMSGGSAEATLDSTQCTDVTVAALKIGAIIE